MDIGIDRIERQRVLGIREEVALAGIGEAIGRLLPEVLACAADRVSGPPLVRYHAWRDDRGTLEVAVRVRMGTEGRGRVVASTLPGGRAVVAVHVGPYSGLKETWAEVHAFMKEQGVEGREAPWEVYLSDCNEVPPERLLTRIVWPIR
jgi:AraC family transcriptional regulator